MNIYLAIILRYLLVFTIVAWGVMLLVGNAHSSAPEIPALGFAAVYALLLSADLARMALTFSLEVK